jgi:carbon-monoxide dehydrogenase medium subunit
VLGSVQIRNMATVGGNVCHATPSADMPPALLVHDGRAEIAGAAGTRAVALSALFSGPGTTTLAPGELLTSIHARAPADSGSCYLRQTVRWSMDLAGVGAAAYVRVSAGAVADARVALGAVAPVPLLVSDAGAPVVGRPFDVEAARRAGQIAAAAARPITDARGTAEYRRRVVEVLVARALHIAWRRATGTWHGRVPPHGRLDEETA